MKNSILIFNLLILLSFYGCGQNDLDTNKRIQYTNLNELNVTDTLIRVYKEDVYELGVPSGYINQKGDTIIPIGKYAYCLLDTVFTYAIVGDPSDFYFIDQNENRLFDVYWIDNGPDYVSDGLFRVKKNGKIGYANKKGQIVIEPQFDCAYPFENGVAKVALECELINDGEYKEMLSEDWFYIDKEGKKL